MSKCLLFIFILFCPVCLPAQSNAADPGGLQKAIGSASQGAEFSELSDPEILPELSPGVASQLHTGTSLFIGFASADLRFSKSTAPANDLLYQRWNAMAWKGEKINWQLVLRSSVALKRVRVNVTDLKNSAGNMIASANLKIGFVRYVISDGLNKEGHGCGIGPGTDSSLQADGIDFIASENIISEKNIAANSTQPIWISIRIPSNAAPGKYAGVINITAENFSRKLNYVVEVLPHLLPAPSQFSFHLDLWQNPFSIARVHKLQPWSAAHFAAMKPYMKMLADAGQKTITVSMIHDPWRGQTYDIYQSMIRWIKKRDGSFNFDYSIFDAWVEFMMKQGISKLINCYTMVPWNNKFYYYDEASGRDTFLIAKTGTPEFKAHWTPMLRSFVSHLKEKKWFDRTCIAMDERPLEDMLRVMELVHSIDKDFKISLAGSYHKELCKEIFDYCIASAETFDPVSLQYRVKNKLPTTFYTYCFEGYPNTFTFSPPAESSFMGWYAANKGFTGYLRWAYNCWPEKPLQDARFSTWSSGDTYFIYPNAGSSIRFEKLIEGIQDYEKIRIIRAQLTAKKEFKKLQQLEDVIKTFEINNIPETSAALMVQRARALLNSL